MARVAYLALVLVVLARLLIEPGEALTCTTPEEQRTGALCNVYTRGDQPEPSGECCNAYRALRALAKSQAERRKLCSCVQEATSQSRYNRGASANPAARIPRFDSLSEKCGLNFLFSADPKFDCNTVN
ncbi:non-specific lipid-transfer protein 1-like [Apium graveolens]|uniref:non-specific lipid-transfer protein 1-like n=1 Tax=Apium graveolens TaxID=4045 RepID=UPI003D7A1C8C